MSGPHNINTRLDSTLSTLWDVPENTISVNDEALSLGSKRSQISMLVSDTLQKTSPILYVTRYCNHGTASMSCTGSSHMSLERSKPNECCPGTVSLRRLLESENNNHPSMSPSTVVQHEMSAASSRLKESVSTLAHKHLVSFKLHLRAIHTNGHDPCHRKSALELVHIEELVLRWSNCRSPTTGGINWKNYQTC